MSAVYELATRRPHEADDERLTAAERPVYERAYYCALRVALQVMELVMRKRALRARDRQRAARLRRVAAGSLDLANPVQSGEPRGVVRDTGGENGEQRADLIKRHYVAVVALPVRITDVDGDELCGGIDLDVDRELERQVLDGHRLTVHPETIAAQQTEERASLSISISATPPGEPGGESGDLAHRSDLREIDRPAQKRKPKNREARARA